MNRRLTKISKYLSFVLKHEPASIGLKLDSEGWVDVETLVTSANSHGKSLAVDHVREVVAQSDEVRFQLSDDGLRIRALRDGKRTL